MTTNKILVITGPTATGKSALAIEIAPWCKKNLGISCEIISADSRQVYRGLDIGSAKITQDEMCGIPHHMIDVANPQDIFTVAEYQKQVHALIQKIYDRGNIPLLCGGTGMYISAVIDNTIFPEVPPNQELRAQLEKLTTEALIHKLTEMDPERSKTIDVNNRVRLVRAIEIATSQKSVLSSSDQLHQLSSPLREEDSHQDTPELDRTLNEGSLPLIRGAVTSHRVTEGSVNQSEVLIIGLTLPKELLIDRITTRINDRIPALFEEIKKLHENGVSFERLESFGLEYRHGSEYVQDKITLEVFKETLATKTWQFVRRQMTWFKRDARIHWMNPVSDKQKILKLVQDFLE